VISMIHLHSSEGIELRGLSFLSAGYSQRGRSRHLRVRFNAVVASANSAATFQVRASGSAAWRAALSRFR